MHILKKSCYVLALLVVLMCIFGFLAFFKESNSDMIKETNCRELLSKKQISSYDTTDIVKKYIPLGLSYNEVISRLEDNDVSVTQSKKVKHFDPKRFTDQDYYGVYVFHWTLFSTTMLTISMTFSKENTLEKVKASCYIESL